MPTLECYPIHSIQRANTDAESDYLESLQDFLIELDMKTLHF